MGLDKSFVQKITIIAIVLVVIGALNWGVVGSTSINPISWLNNITFRSEFLERLIYVLVGIAGLYVLFGIGLFESIS